MINTKAILPMSNFTSHFLKINNILFSSFKQWNLELGMNFKDNIFWWGNRKQRKILHEGIDLHCYINNFGNSTNFGETTKLPAIFAGQIIQIFDDFKGKTIHIIHDIYRNGGDRLHSLYGHTKPLEIINSNYVHEGSTIALLTADTHDIVPPHLHLTVFWASKYIINRNIDWEYINKSKEIELIDPFPIISSQNKV